MYVCVLPPTPKPTRTSVVPAEKPTPRPIDWIVLITQTRDAGQVRNKRLVKIYFSSHTHSAFVRLPRHRATTADAGIQSRYSVPLYYIYYYDVNYKIRVPVLKREKKYHNIVLFKFNSFKLLKI